MAEREITHGHLFCGDGGGAAGFNAAHVRVGTVDAHFRCLGGIDVDPTAIADFGRFAGVPGTLLDLFDREQYRAYHGEEPPSGWTEATPAHIVASFNGERPDIVFTSAPCRGFSGLQSPSRAATNRYQALNRLTLRGIQLLLEAYDGDPVPLILFENVPLIATRGRALLDAIRHELELAGYAVAETVHDCGELGGLAQHRRRFLLVARHREKVRPFVYVPRSQRVRGIGEVLGEMPMPDATAAGPMHRCPRLTWRTWLRLALIPAGKDWRALRDLDVGALRLVEGAAGVADVRGEGTRHNNVFRVVRWSEASPSVTGGGGPSSGGLAVGDVRVKAKENRDDFQTAGHYGVLDWRSPSGAVTSSGQHDNSACSVADPRALPLDEQPDPYPVIISLDATWHRPLTTLELAALQSYDWRELAGVPLAGTSHGEWRIHVGNRVPPDAARACAEVFGEALVRHELSEGFRLDTRAVWVRRLIAAVDSAVTA